MQTNYFIFKYRAIHHGSNSRLFIPRLNFVPPSDKQTFIRYIQGHANNMPDLNKTNIFLYIYLKPVCNKLCKILEKQITNYLLI